MTSTPEEGPAAAGDFDLTHRQPAATSHASSHAANSHASSHAASSSHAANSHASSSPTGAARRWSEGSPGAPEEPSVVLTVKTTCQDSTREVLVCPRDEETRRELRTQRVSQWAPGEGSRVSAGGTTVSLSPDLARSLPGSVPGRATGESLVAPDEGGKPGDTLRGLLPDREHACGKSEKSSKTREHASPWRTLLLSSLMLALGALCMAAFLGNSSLMCPHDLVSDAWEGPAPVEGDSVSTEAASPAQPASTVLPRRSGEVHQGAREQGARQEGVHRQDVPKQGIQPQGVQVLMKEGMQQQDGRKQGIRKEGAHPSAPKVQVTESICGRKWQEEYAALHRNILQGSAPQRYLIDTAIAAGIGDRLIGLATSFYAAVLSKRAFQVVSFGDLPGWESSFSGPNIKWLRTEPPPENITLTLSVPFRQADPPNELPAFDPSGDVWPVWVVNEEEFKEQLYRESDLRAFPPGAESVPHVFVASNRGMTYRMFQNPFVSEELRSWGLTPDTAFFCALDFLFRPRKSLLRASRDIIAPMSDRKALKIAIQIRMGDHAFFDEGEVDLEAAAGNLFRCAQGVEDEMRMFNQTVIWYVVSDSPVVRKRAKEIYGDKVLTATDAALAHVDCRWHPGPCNKTVAEEAMASAIGELVAFSMADVHIVTRYSGFGQIGAFMAKHPLRMYSASLFTEEGCQYTTPSSIAYMPTAGL